MPRIKKQRLKRRADGRYCCVYHGHQFMGSTEEEALQKREEFKRAEQNEHYIRENPTVGQYAERWLPIDGVGLRRVTYNVHVTQMKKLCDQIGDEYIRDVKPGQIKQVFSTAFDGLSEEYISHSKSLYVRMFDAAVADGLIVANPARSQSAKPHKGTRGSHRTITPEERRLMETVATDHRMYPAAMVMLYAGLRPQEVKSLRVEDVDFDNGVIHVRSFVHMETPNHYTVDDIGKTKKATRDVPLFAPVRAALQGKSGYLLSDKNGNVASRAAWAKGWRSYQYAIEKHLNGMTTQHYGHLNKKTRPPWIRFTVLPYDLRHSFATWARDNGVELHTCVEWMGHTDAQMLMRIYDEVTDTRSQKEAERLEKMLNHMQNDMQAMSSNPESP